MATPQVQQTNNPTGTKTGDYIYTVNCRYDGDEYMLKEVKPNRVWTKKQEEALTFHDASGARICLNLFFKGVNLDDIFIGRQRVGA